MKNDDSNEGSGHGEDSDDVDYTCDHDDYVANDVGDDDVDIDDDDDDENDDGDDDDDDDEDDDDADDKRWKYVERTANMVDLW